MRYVPAALPAVLPLLVTAAAASSLPPPGSSTFANGIGAAIWPAVRRRRGTAPPGWNLGRSLSARGGGMGDVDYEEEYDSEVDEPSDVESSEVESSEVESSDVETSEVDLSDIESSDVELVHDELSDDQTSDVESSDDELSEEDLSEEELSEDELSNSEMDSDDVDNAVGTYEESEEEEEEETQGASTPGPPVKLSVRTGLRSTLIDQRIEFAASRTRTVLSLRQAVSRTMPGRPPLPWLQLRHQGRLLDDDEETVDDILEDVDPDDEEEGDGDDDIGDDADLVRLSLTADILPPIDGKFGIELREKVSKMSTQEIMEAYCVNLAGMAYGQELRAREEELYDRRQGEDDDEEEESSPIAENHSINIRTRAAQIQKQFESTLSDETLRLMGEEHERVEEHKKAADAGGEGVGGKERPAFGLKPWADASARPGRGGRASRGGAAASVRRSLQRNLNVNWADTTRNSLLFLFFGYFGGRNSLSRTLLLLGSPMCFLIQTRLVKVAMKQFFYTVGEPPGILLSLLPAPQQAIMSLDYGAAMRRLYGEEALEGEGWLRAERGEGRGSDDDVREDSGFEDNDDDDYSQYDSSDGEGDDNVREDLEFDDDDDGDYDRYNESVYDSEEEY